MDDDKKILYILIGSGPKPLSGYGQYKGDFIDICEKKLAKIEPNKQAVMKTSEYKIYYVNNDNINYLIMTTNYYPMPAAIHCLESMVEEFGPDLKERNFESMEDYGLNPEYKSKLKQKFDFYEKNTEVTNDTLDELKNVMIKFKDELVNTAENLNEREERLIDIQGRTSDLLEQSNEYKMRATRVRKKECSKKTYLIIAIIVIILIIVGVIIFFVT